MTKATIYHNPRCSKSRQTLAILEEAGVATNVVEYLKEPLDEAALRGLGKKLGLGPADFIRRGESVYKELGLKDQLEDDDSLYAAMAANPVLMERPIVVVGRKARLGRPPENVRELL